MLTSSLIYAMIIAISPPLPPPPAPEIAQDMYGDYSGESLWNAWSQWVRTRAAQTRDETFERALEREGWRRAGEGPQSEVSTGYWNEYSRAGYFRHCPEGGGDCQWTYQSVRLSASTDELRAIALATFDGDRLAAAFQAANIAPDAVARDSDLSTGEGADLDAALATTIAFTLYRSDTCPAVADWPQAAGALDPLHLGPQPDVSPRQPPPPYPIHIRQVVNLPVSAYDGADVMIRIDGVRNRAVSDLWQALSEPARTCADRP